MKKCFKCLQILPLNEFYAHKKMADGHLNKCKKCCKSDAVSNIEKNKLDINWVIKERIRCREKQSSKLTSNSQSSSNAKSKWRRLNNEKVNCHTKVRRAIKQGILIKQPCEICSDINSEAHHDDYTKPLNIRWLCSKHHNEHHNFIRLQELKIKHE